MYCLLLFFVKIFFIRLESSIIALIMKPIFDHFNTILPMSEKEVVEITPLLKTKLVAKDESILNEGNTCNFLAFVTKGSFRSFHVNSNGKSTNLMLNSTNEFISNYDSYLSGLPSNISIQAIEMSEVITIFKEDLDKLLDTSLYWNKVGRMMVENIFVISKLRLESILYKTPKERYFELLKCSPDFLKKYSLTDISSFIGVTLQSLSRIRARI